MRLLVLMVMLLMVLLLLAASGGGAAAVVAAVVNAATAAITLSEAEWMQSGGGSGVYKMKCAKLCRQSLDRFKRS